VIASELMVTNASTVVYLEAINVVGTLMYVAFSVKLTQISALIVKWEVTQSSWSPVKFVFLSIISPAPKGNSVSTAVGEKIYSVGKMNLSARTTNQ